MILIAGIGAAGLEVFLRALDRRALLISKVKRRPGRIRHILDEVGHGDDSLVVERRKIGSDNCDGFGSGHAERIAQHCRARTAGVPPSWPSAWTGLRKSRP